MISALKNYWSGLEAREQRLIQLGGPVILVLVLYLLVWQPLQESRQAGTQAQQQEARLLSDLRQMREQLQPVQTMTERQWQALAQSQGLRQVSVREDTGRWVLTAQVRESRQLERFLQAAAEQGWHWDGVSLEGRPMNLHVELRPL